MCLLEGATQTIILKGLVAREVNLTNPNLRSTVDNKGHIYTLLIYRVVGEAYIHLTGFEALRGVVLLDELDILVYNIVRELGVATKLENLVTQVALLALRHTLEVPI